MKYVSLAIDTTGPDPDLHQILSIGITVEDTKDLKPIEELPQVELRIAHNSINGSLMALHLQADLIADLAAYKEGMSQQRVELERTLGRWYVDDVNHVSHFIADFIRTHGAEISRSSDTRVAFTAAGNHFIAYTLKFLSSLPNWDQHLNPEPGVIDPLALYVDWQYDERLPTAGLCKARAGLWPSETSSTLSEALNCIQMLRGRTDNYAHP